MSDCTGHIKDAYENGNLRDAIIDVHFNFTTMKLAHRNFNVPTRALRETINDVNNTHDDRVNNELIALKQNEDRYQVFRWETYYTNTPYTDLRFDSDHELQQVITKVFKGGITVAFGLIEFGVSRTTYYRKMKDILCLLGVSIIKLAKDNYKKKMMKESDCREVVATVSMYKRGKKCKFLPDEETLLVATR